MGRRADLKAHRRFRRKTTKTWCQIYVLRARAGEPIRYVGQTRCATAERLRWHLKDIERCKHIGKRLSPVKAWIDQLPVPPIIEIIDPAGIWDISEAVWIDRMRQRGEPLLNVLSVVA